MPKDKQEYKTGRNFSSHDRNNPVDYKKVRRDVFTLVEQLTESNWILTNSLQHNEQLHRKSLARIKEMRATIEELETSNGDFIDDLRGLSEKLEELKYKMMSIPELEAQLKFLKERDFPCNNKEKN